MVHKRGVLKNLTKLTWKHLCYSFFLTELYTWSLQRLQKRDSSTVFFLWTLRKFLKQIFYTRNWGNASVVLKSLKQALFDKVYRVESSRKSTDFVFYFHLDVIRILLVLPTLEPTNPPPVVPAEYQPLPIYGGKYVLQLQYFSTFLKRNFSIFWKRNFLKTFVKYS